MARVLIVDDERSIRLTFGEFLKAAGHNVVLVEDAYHARDIIQKDLFDVIVTDIVMPGISGDNILIEAKIIGVSDVVEAMAAHRPYRPSRGIAEALDEVSRNRGKLFDPAVADACVRLFSENRFSFN